MKLQFVRALTLGGCLAADERRLLLLGVSNAPEANQEASSGQEVPSWLPCHQWPAVAALQTLPVFAQLAASMRVWHQSNENMPHVSVDGAADSSF